MKPIFAIALPMLMGAITPFPTACGPVRATGDAPDRAVYTSLRSITALHAAPDGAVFAGTAGGILRRDPATGKWQPFTRAELPAHEVRAFTELGGKTCALFAGGGAACYGKDGWYGMPNAARWFAHPPHQIQVRYGDTRLFRKIANAWVAQQEITLPGGAAKEMTAITKAGGAYYVGTRKQGLWRRHGDETVWESVAISEQDPLDHNAQAIAFHDDAMFVSTLQNGLVVRTATGKWQHVAPPTISTNAPRQMITFQNALYVRHGNGVVDRLAGGTWARNIWAHDLPRKQVSAFVSDAGYIYAAQWGGVSVFDGAEWTHYLREPGLQGVPITALAPDGDTLYIGTPAKFAASLTRRTACPTTGSPRLRWVTMARFTPARSWAAWRFAPPVPPDSPLLQAPPAKTSPAFCPSQPGVHFSLPVSGRGSPAHQPSSPNLSQRKSWRRSASPARQPAIHG